MEQPKLRGKLVAFAAAHPDTTLYIKKLQWSASKFSIAYKDAAGNFIDVHTYSRDRDCVRRLKQLGYIQEGRAWRQKKLSLSGNGSSGDVSIAA